MIKQDIEIVEADTMLNTLEIKQKEKYDTLYQENRTQTIIIKYVYKNNGVVFLNTDNKEKPKLKCVFVLHTDKTSSFVSVYDRNNKEIFSGNYLWSNFKANNYNEYLNILKSLHDFKTVVENFS